MCGAVLETENEATGLGRCCWMKFSGRNTVTRVIVAYQPCATRKNARSATIAQQCQYWYMEGNYQCPRKLFCLQLIAQLTEWREDGKKLILLMDENENMENGQL